MERPRPVGSVRQMDHVRAPISRATPKGWFALAFWLLRCYLVAMLILVVLGFVRGSL